MLSGPLIRTRKNQKRYKRYIAQKDEGCDFCAFTADSEQVKTEYRYFWTVINLFGYDNWDGLDVVEHLMIVPKRHVDSISHFDKVEAAEYLQLLAKYESDGYSIYARAAQNAAKTVVHQHTHLIQLGNKKTKAVLYVHKPHVVVYF